MSWFRLPNPNPQIIDAEPVYTQQAQQSYMLVVADEKTLMAIMSAIVFTSPNPPPTTAAIVDKASELLREIKIR